MKEEFLASVMVCIVLTSCNGQNGIPIVLPSVMPKPSFTATLIATKTHPFTFTPTPTITPIDIFLATETPLLLATDYVLEIVNHERPNIQNNFAPFQNIGCDKPDKREYQYRCEEGSPLFDAGCNTITNLPLLGGLSPSYPIALCTLEIDREFAFVELPPNECLYADGFMTTFCNRYIIYKDNNFQLIRSMDEFRKLFAPVDTPNEALAFALADDDRFTVQYNQTKQDNLIYLVSKLEDSYVETVADGYIVHAFFTPLFGCGMFTTDSANVKITSDGQTGKVDYFPVYHTKETICKE